VTCTTECKVLECGTVVSKMIWIRVRRHILYLCIFVDLERDTAEFYNFRLKLCTCFEVLLLEYMAGSVPEQGWKVWERKLSLVPAGKRIIIPRFSNPWLIFYTDGAIAAVFLFFVPCY